MRSRFSIAMCTYNASRYVQQELASFAAQTRLPDELVVCDNVSADDTIELLERFRRSAPFLVRIFRNQTNIGRTKNFEKAIGLCEGDYIATADFDDLWHPNRIQWITEALDADPQAGYVFSDAQLIDAEGKVLPGNLASRSTMRDMRGAFAAEIQAETMIRIPVVTGSTLVMRRDLGNLVLPLSDRWVQDYWITLLASFVGRHGIFLPQPTIQYRIHANQEIGIPNSSWKELPKGGPAVWKSELDQFSDLRERLHSSQEFLGRCQPRALALLDNKIAHLQTRLSANSAPRWRKMKIVCSEAWTGRYQQFSASWLSILRDLL